MMGACLPLTVNMEYSSHVAAPRQHWSSVFLSAEDVTAWPDGGGGVRHSSRKKNLKPFVGAVVKGVRFGK